MPLTHSQLEAVLPAPQQIVTPGDGKTREFHYYDPGVGPGDRLVVCLHGGGCQTAINILLQTGILDLVQIRGWKLLLPLGWKYNPLPADNPPYDDGALLPLLKPGGHYHNDGRIEVFTDDDGNFVGKDDVAFLDQLLTAAIGSLGINAGKIVVMGGSNGATMTNRYAVERGGSLAAVGVFAGTFGANYAIPRSPVAVPCAWYEGTLDPRLKWNGGPITTKNGSSLPIPLARARRMKWNGIDFRSAPDDEFVWPDVDPTDGNCLARTRTWTGGDAPFRFTEVFRGGHTVPGHELDLGEEFDEDDGIPGNTCQDFDATDDFLAFAEDLL